MSGTKTYHKHPQPFRIQKRLVLNQCFKCIASHWRRGATVNYVTFGGEQLYDAMDLVGVFDISAQCLNIISYEENEEVAAKSRICPVATTLSKIGTISVEIVPTVFFENAKPLRELRTDGHFIFFLDDTKTFGERQANTIAELLSSGFLRQSDWLLITSSLRVVYQARFMSRYDGTFHMFYGARISITKDFRARNHVDLLVARTFSNYRPIGVTQGWQLKAVLMRKFKYRDTSGMGLWLYRIDEVSRYAGQLADQQFEEFPYAFEHVPKELEVPNIFDD
jgi:hypothetical protein